MLHTLQDKISELQKDTIPYCKRHIMTWYQKFKIHMTYYLHDN